MNTAGTCADDCARAPLPRHGLRSILSQVLVEGFKCSHSQMQSLLAERVTGVTEHMCYAWHGDSQPFRPATRVVKPLVARPPDKQVAAAAGLSLSHLTSKPTATHTLHCPAVPCTYNKYAA